MHFFRSFDDIQRLPVDKCRDDSGKNDDGGEKPQISVASDRVEADFKALLLKGLRLSPWFLIGLGQYPP